jgi:hypothetical protein
MDGVECGFDEDEGYRVASVFAKGHEVEGWARWPGLIA